MKKDKINFFNFLNYFVKNNLSECYSSYLESITRLSSNAFMKNPLIDCDTKLINLDKLKDDLYDNCLKEKQKPSSLDALFFNRHKSTLFLIEFKGEPLDFKTNKDYFKKDLLPLLERRCSITECAINKINFKKVKKIYETYEDEIYSHLILKPIETILIMFPDLYEYYVKVNHVKAENQINNFLNFLLNEVNIKVIVVYPGNKHNPMNEEYISFKDKIKGKYRLYIPNIFQESHVLNDNDFEKYVLPKIKSDSL